jgi:hypothetical protein
MPKGPFIVGEYYFLDCAEFENVCCLSIGAVILKVFFNCVVSQRSGQIAILKLSLKRRIFTRLLFKYFFKFLDGFLNFA